MVLVEVYERIRELRKNHLHLSQTDFGNRLGVSRSVINNIERNALARPDQKLSLIKLVCKEFSVNEDWLLNGNEPKFVQPDTFSLDEFIRQHGGTDLELNIVKTYFELAPDLRKTIMQHFRTRLSAVAPEQDQPAAIQAPAENGWNNMTIEEAEAEYIKSRSGNAQKEDSSVSSITAERKIVNQ